MIISVLTILLITLLQTNNQLFVNTAMVTASSQKEYCDHHHHSGRKEAPKTRVASVEDELKKVWIKTVKVEQRTVLLERLVRAGVGTNDVEDFERGQVNGTGGFNTETRNEELIETNKVFKIRDCRLEEILLRKKGVN
jgi:hypothetical protein